MDRQDLITIAKRLRQKKDALKKQIEAGKFDKAVMKRKIIIPRQLFEASLELKSDKWLFNGFVIDIEGELIVVDPGVDFYSRFTATGLSTTNIGALILSHGHIDHAASVDQFIEKILRNKFKKTYIFIPKNAFEMESSSYFQKKIASLSYIELGLISDNEKKSVYKIFGNYALKFLPLFHGPTEASNSFGFKLGLKNLKIGYVADTGYAIQVKTSAGLRKPEAAEGKFVSINKKHAYIKEFYSDVEVAVVNINDLQYNRHSKYHLSGWDVLDMFKTSSLKRMVLQHISPVNAEGEDSNYIYKLFFSREPYEIVLPHYLSRLIPI